MTPPLTPALIAEQLAICDAATPGPWKLSNCHKYDHNEQRPMLCYALRDADGNRINEDNDKKFSISARAHYRAALEMAARVAELEAEVDRLLFRAHEDCTMKRGFDAAIAENSKLREKVKEMEDKLKKQGNEYNYVYDGMADKNFRLREALRFYGDARSYEYGGDMGRALHSLDCDVVLDAGERARRALGE